MTVMVPILIAVVAALLVTAYLLGAARSRPPQWASVTSRADARDGGTDALAREVAAAVVSALMAGTAERAGANSQSGSVADGGEA
jgi:hypothetical protein